MELRMSMATEAAALAAERRTETHLLRMVSALSSADNDPLTVSGGSNKDRIFHREIAIATGNSRFLMFIGQAEAEAHQKAAGEGRELA